MKLIYMRKHPSLTRLRALEAVCRTGSFSAAAEKLFLTQPAISTQIRQLEGELGVMLVERVGKSAMATHAGRILLAGSGRAFAALDASLDEIAELKNEISGPLRIGAGGTATTYLLPPVFAELERRHPKVEPSIATGNTAEIVASVVQATLDLALVTGPVAHPSLASAFFFEDRLVCIAPARDLKGMDVVRPQHLAGRRLILYGPGGAIRDHIDTWLGPSKQPRPRIVDVENAEAQKSFVAAGFGWAILSEMAVADHRARGKFKMIALAPKLSRELRVVWRRDRAETPLIAAARACFDAHS